MSGGNGKCRCIMYSCIHDYTTFTMYEPIDSTVSFKPLSTEELMRIAIMDADDKIVR